MKSIYKDKSALIFILLLFTGVMTSCSFNFSDREYEKVTQDQNFSFDPKLVLTSIREGKTGIFTAVDTPSKTSPNAEPVTFHQKDYLEIAEAIHKFTWGESLDGWQLHEMNFASRCSEIESGFESGYFEFFSVIKNDQGEKRIKHKIGIEATDHSIFISESEYQPKLRDWKTINITKMKFDADDSLKIAENNGGRQKRLDIQNQCSVLTMIAAESVTPDQWLFRYREYQNPKTAFQIEINSVTGEYQK